MPFLRQLFGEFRAFEMAFAPWTAEQKRVFLDDQFRLQHLHFTRTFAGADFWVVLQGEAHAAERPVGRLYLDRRSAVWRIVDIGFAAEMRGAGLGGALIHWVQQSACDAGASGIALSVAVNNPRAQKLYERLGFLCDGPAETMHQSMLWRIS